MNKIVRYEDRAALNIIEGECAQLSCHGEAAELLRRLRAAAEADKPALPEGWVLGDGFPFWHNGAGGISLRPDQPAHGRVDNYGTVTPLTTAASIAPEGWRVVAANRGHGNDYAEIRDADNKAVMRRDYGPEHAAFDVLAALITAAQAERGQA